MVDLRNIQLICKPSTFVKEFVVLHSSLQSKKKNKDFYALNRNEYNIINKKNHLFDNECFEKYLLSIEENNIESQQKPFPSLPSFDQFYNTTQQISQYKNWNMFSVIHSTPNHQFDFILYNASHRLKENEIIERKTKVRITFPSSGSYFIIFHGRLVHNGADNVEGDDGNYNSGIRLFSYLNVPIHNISSATNCSSTRLTTYTKNINDGTVDTSSFSISSDNSTDIFTHIKLPSYTCNSSKNIIPILGNINDDGWEIYKGMQFSSPQLRKFQDDLPILTSKHYTKFSGITNQKNRRSYNISSLDATLNNSISSLRSLHKSFQVLQYDFLRKIPYLDEVDIHKQIILCNMGKVYEQIPHRDFSAIKK